MTLRPVSKSQRPNPKAPCTFIVDTQAKRGPYIGTKGLSIYYMGTWSLRGNKTNAKAL